MNYAFVIEPSSHAELSASTADRWIACPGSVELSRGVERKATKYAAEGTAAHYIAAQSLKNWEEPEDWLGKTALVEGYDIPLDEKLIGAVQEYVDYIRSEKLAGDKDKIEQDLTPALSKLHPKLGGSADYIRWRPGERLLTTADYKHGAGVAVEVEDNRQLKIYALGALLANPQWNAANVEIVIVQPRCEHPDGKIRKFTIPVLPLVTFAADLVDGANATEKPDAPLVPGKKACKFCPAMSKCGPGQEQKQRATVMYHFRKNQVARAEDFEAI